MKYYQLLTDDLSHDRWLLFDELRGESSCSLTVKPKYEKLVCPKCHQADHNAVFEHGFDNSADFKSKKYLFETTDEFLCIDKRVKKLLCVHRVRGFKLKPIGRDGWWVVNVSLRVKAIRVYKTELQDGRRLCPRCKRALSMFGLYEFERQIDPPKMSRAFFTVVYERQGTQKGPDVFVTEDVVEIFQAAGIRGCSFRKLLNLQEERAYKKSIRDGDEHWPPGCFINL